MLSPKNLYPFASTIGFTRTLPTLVRLGKSQKQFLCHKRKMLRRMHYIQQGRGRGRAKLKGFPQPDLNLKVGLKLGAPDS